MERFTISNLMVYHIEETGGIKEFPCVVLGDGEMAKLQRHIIRSIYV